MSSKTHLKHLIDTKVTSKTISMCFNRLQLSLRVCEDFLLSLILIFLLLIVTQSLSQMLQSNLLHFRVELKYFIQIQNPSLFFSFYLAESFKQRQQNVLYKSDLCNRFSDSISADKMIVFHEIVFSEILHLSMKGATGKLSFFSLSDC